MRLPAYTQYPGIRSVCVHESNVILDKHSVQETRSTGATSPDLYSEIPTANVVLLARLLRGDHPKEELDLRKAFTDWHREKGLPRACIRQMFCGIVRTSQDRADQQHRIVRYGRTGLCDPDPRGWQLSPVGGTGDHL